MTTELVDEAMTVVTGFAGIEDEMVALLGHVAARKLLVQVQKKLSFDALLDEPWNGSRFLPLEAECASHPEEISLDFFPPRGGRVHHAEGKIALPRLGVTAQSAGRDIVVAAYEKPDLPFRPLLRCDLERLKELDGEERGAI
jgi:hypothetical protein